MPLQLDNPFAINPFARVYVDYAIRGAARVSWILSNHFYGTEPFSYQVQVAESDTPNANWSNVGSPVTGTTLNTLLSSNDGTAPLKSGKEALVFYRVVLTEAGPGSSYISPTASVLGDLPFSLWLKYQEVVRKENLRLSRLKAGNQGYLLKAKRSGTPCTACTDLYTQEQTDSKCSLCFGMRFVGGYYQDVTNIYFDVSPIGRYTKQDLQARGMVNDTTVTTARIVAFPYVSTYDIFADKASDLRYFIHEVETEAHIQMVPLVQKVKLKLIPFDNVIYNLTVG